MSIRQPRPGGEVDAVDVGGLPILDGSQNDAIEFMSVPRSATFIATDLHIGALVHRSNMMFVQSVRSADVAFADGVSMVLLARLAGAVRIERTPVTDVGGTIVDRLAKRLERRARVVLLGGPPGLAEAAAERLEAEHDAKVVLTDHGFHEEWVDVLNVVRDAEPDIVCVGLGTPLESIWCQAHRAELPPCLILTVGGWFGHLTGAERRAPVWVRDIGMEWTWRLAQSPRRLASRYAKGVLAAVVVASRILVTRLARSTGRFGGTE